MLDIAARLAVVPLAENVIAESVSLLHSQRDTS